MALTREQVQDEREQAVGLLEQLVADLDSGFEKVRKQVNAVQARVIHHKHEVTNRLADPNQHDYGWGLIGTVTALETQWDAVVDNTRMVFQLAKQNAAHAMVHAAKAGLLDEYGS